MNHAWMVFAAAAALVSASGSKSRNTLKLPSFRGVAEARSGIPRRLRLYMPAIAERPARLLKNSRLELDITPSLFIANPLKRLRAARRSKRIRRRPKNQVDVSRRTSAFNYFDVLEPLFRLDVEFDDLPVDDSSANDRLFRRPQFKIDVPILRERRR